MWAWAIQADAQPEIESLKLFCVLSEANSICSIRCTVLPIVVWCVHTWRIIRTSFSNNQVIIWHSIILIRQFCKCGRNQLNLITNCGMPVDVLFINIALFNIKNQYSALVFRTRRALSLRVFHFRSVFILRACGLFASNCILTSGGRCSSLENQQMMMVDLFMCGRWNSFRTHLSIILYRITHSWIVRILGSVLTTIPANENYPTNIDTFGRKFTQAAMFVLNENKMLVNKLSIINRIHVNHWLNWEWIFLEPNSYNLFAWWLFYAFLKCVPTETITSEWTEKCVYVCVCVSRELNVSSRSALTACHVNNAAL